jgi:hypothetical protein
MFPENSNLRSDMIKIQIITCPACHNHLIPVEGNFFVIGELCRCPRCFHLCTIVEITLAEKL